jgi:hypothetical protein
MYVFELKINKIRVSVRPRRRSCAGPENSMSPLRRLLDFVRVSGGRGRCS